MSVLGVWMWPQSIIDHGAQWVAERCTLIGVTDIFFLTKGLAGTASYRSAFAPPCSPRDLLAELIKAAHASGIRVHAWLTSASDEHYKQAFPQSGRCHYTRGKDKGLISLADEGYLSYMENIVRELCLGYAILPQYRGKGYATESCLAVLDYCKECDYAEEVFVNISTENIASKKVYEKVSAKRDILKKI